MLEQSFSTFSHAVKTQKNVYCSKTWRRAFSRVCTIHHLSREKYGGAIKPVVFWVWSASKQTAKMDGQSSHHKGSDLFSKFDSLPKNAHSFILLPYMLFSSRRSQRMTNVLHPGQLVELRTAPLCFRWSLTAPRSCAGFDEM